LCSGSIRACPRADFPLDSVALDPGHRVQSSVRVSAWYQSRDPVLPVCSARFDNSFSDSFSGSNRDEDFETRNCFTFRRILDPLVSGRCSEGGIVYSLGSTEFTRTRTGSAWPRRPTILCLTRTHRPGCSGATFRLVFDRIERNRKRSGS
jgi:hypothetical protein